MQTTPATSDSGDLRDVWCSTARRATDAQLAACVVVALAAVVASGVGLFIDVRRTLRWWPLVLPALFLGAFGIWAIADRELRERSPARSTRVLAVVKIGSVVAAAAVGALAAIGVLGLTIGTWIS